MHVGFAVLRARRAAYADGCPPRLWEGGSHSDPRPALSRASDRFVPFSKNLHEIKINDLPWSRLGRIVARAAATSAVQGLASALLLQAGDRPRRPGHAARLAVA